MATQTEAPKEIINDDPESFDNVEPDNVAIKEGKFGLDIVQANKKNRNFTIKTPLLELAFAKLSGEGDLGEIYDSKGNKQTKRDLAKFSMLLRMGLANMDDELRDIEAEKPEQHRVPAQQARFFDKLHHIGRAILGQVYDNEPKGFGKFIKEAKENVHKEELLVFKGANSPIKTEKDLLKAMEEDEELKTKITSAYRERFISDARFKFDDPEDYDETGCVQKENEAGESKTYHLSVKLKRKVWRLRKGVTKDDACEVPPFTDKMSVEAWPDLVTKMRSYEYNPFSYFDPSTKSYIERPKFIVGEPDEADDEPETIEDPFWDPFTNMSTLVSAQLMFSVFQIAGQMYGVKAMPYKKLTIWRQKEYVKRDETVGYDNALAGGFKKRKPVQSSESSASEPPKKVFYKDEDGSRMSRNMDGDEGINEAELEAMMQ
jgi:hypothetical protein